MAMLGWAFSINRNIVVPDRGVPTTNRGVFLFSSSDITQPSCQRQIRLLAAAREP
jgi:hypothetical protein